MQECPRCGGSVESDPEHAGVKRCMACWEVVARPTERPCSGYRPMLNSALRTLESFRHLRRRGLSVVPTRRFAGPLVTWSVTPLPKRAENPTRSGVSAGVRGGT